MRIALAVTLLSACGLTETAEVAVELDRGLVDDALAAADPEPFVDLVDDPTAVVPLEVGCPLVELDGDREIWSGGCEQSDGTRIEGLLERHVGLDASWISADAFSVSRDGVLELYLDGAVELFIDGDLLLLDAAASLCAEGGLDCSAGPVTVDLSWSLFPASRYPSAYVATVSGVVAASGESPSTVQGAWSIDDASCDTEPVEGTFALRRGERHALVMDGGEACDGCAAWVVQGLEVPAFCGVSL